MSRSIHVPEPHHFTVGTVGPPGQRTFFIQTADEGSLVSFKIEKQQVAALAEYLDSVLADLPAPAAPLPPAPELVEPVVPEWVVGGIGIAVDPGSDRILLVVHELMPEPTEESAVDEVADLLAELADLDVEGDGDGDDDEDEFDEELGFDDEDEGSMARIRLTREQVAAFIERAAELIDAGRPLCPFCGLPSDPTGHFCPRAN